jgi:hypothetical protein
MPIILPLHQLAMAFLVLLACVQLDFTLLLLRGQPPPRF